jgi:hypothetical protein
VRELEECLGIPRTIDTETLTEDFGKKHEICSAALEIFKMDGYFLDNPRIHIDVALNTRKKT